MDYGGGKGVENITEGVNCGGVKQARIQGEGLWGMCPPPPWA